MKKPLALVLYVLLATSVYAQNDTTDSAHKAVPQTSAARSTASDIRELKDAIAAQQQQIQQLQEQQRQSQQQIRSRDEAIQSLQQQVGQAQAAAAEAQKAAASAALAHAPKSADEIADLEHQVTDLKAVTAQSLIETDKRVANLESPTSIHFKGVTLTPGGFVAADTVWRSHAMYSDIGTQFNAIPFSAAGQARASDFYGSGRASRLSLLAKGKLGDTVLTAYYEADFLGVGVASTNNQSNSYVFRQRQLWSQAAFHNGWAFAGGQMWSLATEMKSGLDPLTWLSPQVIDTQYNAGFSYLRQYGVRITKNFNDKVWFGMSVENAQTLLTVSGNPANFLIGGPGNGSSGGYNSLANYSSNYTPDFVVKAAFEPGFGHYEIFGIASLFRARIYPNATATTPSAAGAFNDNTAGGGLGANARWLVAQKHLEIGVHYLGGNGVGRYGASQQPDATVYGDGYEHLIRSYQGLLSVEYHAPKWDLNLYGGGEYAGRQASLYKGKPVGYGSPLFVNKGCGTETLPTAANGFAPGSLTNCSGNTRAIFEGTAAFFYRFYNGPKGRLQLGAQYSYLTRDAWSGIGGQPEATENMVFSSFRYYLP
jgi:metal-responsive CopG/Arc/MetJ family transcriptional regulator